MRKLFLLLAILYLTFGCTKAIKPTSFNTIEVETTGIGQTENDALKDAFQKASIEVAGVYVYSSSNIENRKLMKDTILTYSGGFIESHKILDKIEEKDLIILRVKSYIDIRRLKYKVSKVFGRDIESIYEAVLRLSEVENNNAKLLEANQLMKELIGDYNTFFERAYKADIIGYEITNLNGDEIEGNYLVRLGLNQFFWKQFENILAVSSIKGGQVAISPNGLYNSGCTQSLKYTYLSPSSFSLYQVETELHYKRPRTGNHVLRLIKNSIMYNPTLLGSNGYGNLTGASLTYNGPNCTNGYIAFKKEVTLRIPFKERNASAIKEAVIKNNIPWQIKPQKPLDILLER